MNENIIKIVNPTQACAYLKNGLKPLRLEVGYNNKIVFVYNKEDTTELFHRWIHKEL